MQRLYTANEQGWGAYLAIGLRHKGLGRYRRGGVGDVLALPALFVDVDNPSLETLKQLQAVQPSPSCIIFSGGGYHAYWWLDEPLSDMNLARTLLRGLARSSHGDFLSPAQSLRLVGTVNTKPSRNNALCRILQLDKTYYPLQAFTDYMEKPMSPKIVRQIPNSARHPPYKLNPEMLKNVTDYFLRGGYKQRGDWLTGACIYPERHLHADAHPSFGFNTRTGYGNCYRCGSVLLKDICLILGIQL